MHPPPPGHAHPLPPHPALTSLYARRPQTRQAQTCIYAVGRVRELLSSIKWSKTTEQGQDYHVVLTALAARRGEVDSDTDGMVDRIAAELGVTPGKRCVARIATAPSRLLSSHG